MKVEGIIGAIERGEKIGNNRVDRKRSGLEMASDKI